MQGDAMHAMADFRVRIGNVLRVQPAIDRLPGFAAIIRAERARRRNRDENALRIFRIEQDRVQTHSARARLPFRAGAVLAQAGQLLPRFAAIRRFEKRGVFHARINVIGIVERRLEVPDALEFPRMLRAVVPLMRAGHAVVNKFVALAFGHSLRARQFVRRPACSRFCRHHRSAE